MTKRLFIPTIAYDGKYIVSPTPRDSVLATTDASVADPFTESATQLWPLGTELKYGGRTFRYAKAGASALDVGKLMQSVVPLAGHIDEAIDTPAIGATVINFTPNTGTTDDLTANELADGYITINDDTGEGYIYRIKSHPAILGAASGAITLQDPIRVACGASATATVFHNPYRNVIVHPSPPTAPVVGVTVIAVTANYYCWLQTKGPAAVLTAGTIAIARSVMACSVNNIDGGVEQWTLTDLHASAADTEICPPIGTVMAVNIDTEYSTINLYIP